MCVCEICFNFYYQMDRWPLCEIYGRLSVIFRIVLEKVKQSKFSKDFFNFERDCEREREMERFSRRAFMEMDSLSLSLSSLYNLRI